MWFGSIPMMYYPLTAEEIPVPPHGFFLLTDLTDFLLTDHTPLETAGA